MQVTAYKGIDRKDYLRQNRVQATSQSLEMCPECLKHLVNLEDEVTRKIRDRGRSRGSEES